MSSKTSETTEGGLPAAGRTRVGPAGGAAPLAGLPHTVLRPEPEGVQLNLRDLWAYRELLYFLTWRDIKVRYKQTLMGVAWVVLQPLMTMLIFTLVFTRFVKADAGDIPYPLFAYAGLMLWTFFQVSVTSSTHSLITNTSLITKVYFPRAFIPAAAVGAGLLDLSVAAVPLAALAVYYRVQVTWGLLLLPFFVLLGAMLALSVGMVASALTVRYRDLRHALPFLLQLWMFASPVLYPVRLVGERWRWAFAANPMTGVLEGFRSALTGTPFDWQLIAVPAAAAPVLVFVAFYVFRRLEDTFADII
ncbi:MAG TPA: ABC transporter permease [Pyrinomonadaceae bacterium]|nr:ABC transporter permease [Pyrinomonadaceae bacterium]